MNLATLSAEYSANGFAVLPRVLDPGSLTSARAEADRLLAAATERGGCRVALRETVELRRLGLAGSLLGPAREVLGYRAKPVKLTIFDKTPVANWKVPWHQDLTITVRERREVPGFGPWSVKAGIPNVQPPAEVLEGVLALRVYLDDTPAWNGALRVLAGSHRAGRLSDDDLGSAADRFELAVPELEAGDVLVMSPLLVHASSAAERAGRRRVLHYEYAGRRLPGGLSWS